MVDELSASQTLFSISRARSAEGVNIPFGDPRLNYAEVVNDSSYNSVPGMTQLADGTLVVVYLKGTSSGSDADSIVIRKSSDLRNTWSGESLLVADPRYGPRDPNIALLNDGVRRLVGMLPSRMHFR